MSLIHISEPTRLGLVSYAVQTDQSERLVLHTHRGEQFDKTIAVLKEVGGTELGDLASEEVTGQTTTSQEALSLSLMHISAPTSLGMISNADF